MSIEKLTKLELDVISVIVFAQVKLSTPLPNVEGDSDGVVDAVGGG